MFDFVLHHFDVSLEWRMCKSFTLSFKYVCHHSGLFKKEKGVNAVYSMLQSSSVSSGTLTLTTALLWSCNQRFFKNRCSYIQTLWLYSLVSVFVLTPWVSLCPAPPCVFLLSPCLYVSFLLLCYFLFYFVSSRRLCLVPCFTSPFLAVLD